MKGGFEPATLESQVEHSTTEPKPLLTRNSNNSSTVNFPQLNLIIEQFELGEITNHDIITPLNKMQTKLSVGPDLIPSSFLKRCNLAVIHPLRLLFCQSLTQGLMPEIWKKSYITLVHKSRNVHDVTNYRPISMMRCVAKLFESIITDKLPCTSFILFLNRRMAS